MAVLSTMFAAMTAILGKMGVQSGNFNFAPLILTFVVFAGLTVVFTNSANSSLQSRREAARFWRIQAQAPALLGFAIIIC